MSVGKQTIQWVLDNDLCTGCGVCVGVCPKGALRIDPTRRAEPVMDRALCVECGLCWRVCPGKGVHFSELAEPEVPAEATEHPEIGHVLSVKGAFATDPEVRSNGASGGVATALASWMLRTGQVDGVVIVETGGPDIFGVQARIARYEEAILRGQQSKYLMASFGEVVSEMLRTQGRYLVTGLPCQLAAISALFRVRPKLLERVPLMVGLLCGYAVEPGVADCMCRFLGVAREKVAEFLGWRAMEYPGSFAFRTADGRLWQIPLRKWLDLGEAHYARLRCHLCPDGLARCADLALGDVSSVTHGLSETLILTRTARGDALLTRAEKEGVIAAQVLRLDEMVRGGTIAFMYRNKVRKPLALIRELSRKGKPTPDYDIQGVSLTRSDVLEARSFYSLSRLMRGPVVDRLLRAFPRLNLLVGREVYRHHGRRLWKGLAWLGIL